MQPPIEGRSACVLLIQDNKPICRTRCSGDLPSKIPNTWTISKYKPRSCCHWNDFPKFNLLPEPQNVHQTREWGQFLSYLQRDEKVAIAYADCFHFYILANGDQNNTRCTVHHWNQSSGHKKNAAVNHHSRDSMNSLKESYRSGRSLQRSAPICPSPSSLSFFEDIVMDSENLRNNNHTADNSFKSAKGRDYVSIIQECNDVKTSRKTTQQRVSDNDIHFDSATSDHADGMLSDFRQKNNVMMDPSYLTTISQTHSWIFGAIAELVDNSRDAYAARLDISVELLYSKRDGNKIPVLSIIDDGAGMTHNEILRMVSFGHKQTDEHHDRIGKFGIGFKTGAMKLGKDALVLTQSSGSRSIAFLSQSYNKNKHNLQVPIVSYTKNGRYMDIDLNIQSEEFAHFNLSAIKEFSPFNEYLLGEQLGLFGLNGTGTQIFIWNLDKWSSDYTLVWNDGKGSGSYDQGEGDIHIRSRRIRSRLGQISREVPLDYSLKAYLEVLFLNPRMKIFIQGSLIKSCSLEKSLSGIVTINGSIMARPVQLVIGRSLIEWERMNGGVFLYWKGRLIEAYKRVGGMKHNADVGRGVIGVVDVTEIMDNGNGEVWVLHDKQGFQDCEPYAKLEDWLGSKADEYWDENYDNLDLKTNAILYKPDHEWVQCDKCRKWRMLSSSFDAKSLPLQWFCYMLPFNGYCEAPEQQVEAGVVTVAAMRCQQQESSMPLAIKAASNKADSQRKNDATVCEEWGRQKRRSNRLLKASEQATPCATNTDFRPVQAKNFKMNGIREKD